MIRLATLNQILACVSTISLVAPCIAAPAPTASRERAVQILDRELHKASGWVQIHAADALLDHGMTREVRAVFSPMSEHPPSACCIGVWRVMARAAAARQSRAGFVEKIRKVMLDAKATNRLEAAESLAKLGASIPSDRDALIQWLDTANEAIAPYPQWLLVLSSTGRQRATAEASLADLLNSDNPLARLRAAFALGRIKSLSSESFVKLCDRLKREPSVSPARVYLITAALLHAKKDPIFVHKLKHELIGYLTKGKPNEQLEAATVLGMRGNHGDIPALESLLANPEPDARIGAANGLLYLLK